MRHASAFTLALVVLPACFASAKSATPSPAILPLKQLRLYETGVGYFERSGMVAQGASASLPVPAGHLDDALKTLVVLSADAMASVQGLEFGSSASKGMARALAGLPLDSDAPITYHDLLASLKGAQVSVRPIGAPPFVGRLVDVLEGPATVDPATKKEREPELTLLVLTRDAEIRRFRAAEVVSVRPTEPLFAARLDAALDALSLRGAQAQRSLRVVARSSAPVTLGYIAETPVWRTTYRMVFADGGAGAVLQGWALLHNDTDEDWHQVRVHLVNGRPDSFLYPLAAPRYLRRELVHPDEELSTVPQLLDTTVDTIWGDHIGDSIGVGGLGTIGHGSGGGGSGEGYGSGSGRIGVTHASVGPSSLVTVGNLAKAAQAAGVEAGALFTYSLAEAIELRAHGSALVPFLQQPVEVSPITLFGAPGEAGRSAARIANSTRQTLPAGTIAFFESGGFAGESGLDRLKPGERRFVEYGADLDVELTSEPLTARDEPKRLTFADDRLEEHFIKRTTERYTVENRGGHDRSIYLALGVVANAKVTGADELDFDTASSRPLAIFRVKARQRLQREVAIDQGLSRATAVDQLSRERLLALAGQAGLPAADRDAAKEAAAAQGKLEETRIESVKAGDEVKEVGRDLDRLREHLKALGGDKSSGGGAGATNLFVQRILAAEDKLTALRHRLEWLEGEHTRQREAVRAALGKLKTRA